MIFIKRRLLGLPIYETTLVDLIKVLDNKIKKNEKTIVFGLSAGSYGRLKKRKDLVELYQKMDILIADGQGIPLLGKLFGVPIRESIGIVNLTYRMLELANENNYKVLMFGATQKINNKANKVIKENYPNIRLCSGINGYFNKQDELDIVNRINIENPDILFIGISYPIKERFSVIYKDKLNVKIIIPNGGAFDVIAGKVKRPPILIKSFPITWFYRFLQEPNRLFYATFITVLYSVLYVFPILFLKHKLRIEKNPSIIKFFKL